MLAGIYRLLVGFMGVFAALILFCVGFVACGGVVCLCAGMVVADMPERVHEFVNGGDVCDG